jgi:hypothetical protein
VTDARRLGKRGAYRLGQLRAQGIAAGRPPRPFRPRFTRAHERGPLALLLAAVVVGIAVVAAGAVFDLWFMPFAVGLASGLADRFWGCGPRLMLPSAAVMAVVGWAIPIAWPALHGVPYRATARVIAALTGLPAHSSVGIGLALLVALVEALAGLWLGRALSPHPAED